MTSGVTYLVALAGCANEYKVHDLAIEREKKMDCETGYTISTEKIKRKEAIIKIKTMISIIYFFPMMYSLSIIIIINISLPF